jgi:RND superfamily putative drug exporter
LGLIASVRRRLVSHQPWRLRPSADGLDEPRDACSGERLGERPPGLAASLPVAAAGIILAGTFTALLLIGIAPLMQIGFAVSTGMLITALVMATLLVPSVTALLGHRAWWPGHRQQ